MSVSQKPKTKSNTYNMWPKAIYGLGKSACIVTDGVKKVHTELSADVEMVEEYSGKDTLLVRKFRGLNQFGGQGEWTYEVGTPPENQSESSSSSSSSSLIRKASNQPKFVRKDRAKHFLWTIANLPYDQDVYSIEVDSDAQELVLRTSNKKYYKRWLVEDLLRADITLDSDAISFTYNSDKQKLLITYEKPKQILREEAYAREQRSKMIESSEGDMDCKQQ